MKKIAHRGYTTSLIKENTLAAFENAVNNEFDGIECDVRKTKDGKLVIIHDAWINRTSEESGLVRDHTYEELLEYNFGSKEVPSKIPTLEEVLRNIKIMKLIEIKEDIDLKDVLELVDDKTYFISFDAGLINRLKAKHPQLKFGVLNYVFNTEIDYDLDAICILDLIASDELVEHFLDRGIKVFIYGIVGDINYKRDYENLYYIVNKKFNS